MRCESSRSEGDFSEWCYLGGRKLRVDPCVRKDVDELIVSVAEGSDGVWALNCAVYAGAVVVWEVCVGKRLVRREGVVGNGDGVQERRSRHRTGHKLDGRIRHLRRVIHAEVRRLREGRKAGKRHHKTRMFFSQLGIASDIPNLLVALEKYRGLMKIKCKQRHEQLSAKKRRALNRVFGERGPKVLMKGDGGRGGECESS